MQAVKQVRKEEEDGEGSTSSDESSSSSDEHDIYRPDELPVKKKRHQHTSSSQKKDVVQDKQPSIPDEAAKKRELDSYYVQGGGDPASGCNIMMGDASVPADLTRRDGECHKGTELDTAVTSSDTCRAAVELVELM